MIPTLLDSLFEFATDPRVVAFFSFCLGFYILRDVARVGFQLFTHLRRPADPNNNDAND